MSRINSQRTRALLGGLILTLNLAACKNNSNVKPQAVKPATSTIETTDNLKIQYILVGDKLLPFNNLKLTDGKNIIEKIDGVIIGKEIVQVENPVDIFFNNSIQYVIIDGQLIDWKNFGLVDETTNTIVTSIDGIFIDNQLYDIEKVFEAYKNKTNGNLTTNTDRIILNGSKEETKEEVKTYILTDEKFEKLADEVYAKLTEKKIAITKEQLIDLLMIVNIDNLSRNNTALIKKIVGSSDPDEIFATANVVMSSLMNYNNDLFCAGKSMKENINASEFVYDQNVADKCREIEKRIVEVETSVNEKDNDNANVLVNKLLMDMLDSTNGLSTIESGAGYLEMYLGLNNVRLRYDVDKHILDASNKELIKNFVVYAGDGVQYEENSKSTGFYRNINYLLKECEKTKTK